MILDGETECVCPRCEKRWGHAIHHDATRLRHCYCVAHAPFRGYPAHDLWWREYIGDGVVR